MNEPDVSLVMPCYNEEGNLGYTVPRLLDAFAKAGHRLQLVTVNNGSKDGTARVIAELAAKHPEITPGNVEVNIGFGKGVLTGIALARAPWIGMVAADGQVDAEDVVRLYDACVTSGSQPLGKVRRRFRMDGPLRKVISICYNMFVWMLWPGIGSLDVNGNPRMLHREVIDAMQLTSTNWLLDPEMIIKSHYMGVRILELNVFARMRGNGLSHVRLSTCWEFFRELLSYRFTGRLDPWRRTLAASGAAGRSPAQAA